MNSPIASLGMYDHPAQQAANDQLWTAIARVLRDRGVQAVPNRLDRTQSVHAAWRNPGLLLAQACGYPLTVDLTLALRVVALPVYSAPGCVGATHRSMIVVRAGDERRSLAAFRDARAAINDRASNTGMNLFRATMAPIAGPLAADTPFFDAVIETGSHRASIVAVGTGDADIASIDCISYAAIDRFEPDLTARLRIIARSPVSPTLPFVTAASASPDTVAALEAALHHVIADPDLAEARASLFLTGLASADDGFLAPIRKLEADAALAGYGELR